MIGADTHALRHRGKQVGDGRLPLVDDLPAGRKEISAAPSQKRGQLIVQVRVTVGKTAAVTDHRVVQQVRIAFLRIPELLEEAREQLDVIGVDRTDFVQQYGRLEPSRPIMTVATRVRSA